jgi:hypothetical protein
MLWRVGEKRGQATFPLLIEQLISSTRQMQTSIEKGAFQTFQSFQPFNR